MSRRFAVLAAAVMLIVSACGGSGTSGATATTAPVAVATTAAPAPCTVGVSWNNYQEERWAHWDEPAIKAAIAAGGGKYVSNDAKSSPETQATNVDNLITQGAKVLIVLAQDGTAIKPAVAKAIQNGVAVIAYDRLIEDPKALYITFDNVLVGKLEAQEVFKAKASGQLRDHQGQQRRRECRLPPGRLRPGHRYRRHVRRHQIVGETYTDNWDPAKAQTEMEQFLTANNNKVDAVLSENDGMAGGVVAALTAQGLAGQVPVSGQDGDQAALNRVALGTQTVDVWKDARALGKRVPEGCDAAMQELRHHQGHGHCPVQDARRERVSSILLQPDPITAANLKDVSTRPGSRGGSVPGASRPGRTPPAISALAPRVGNAPCPAHVGAGARLIST